jgi:hypothetical protein
VGAVIHLDYTIHSEKGYFPALMFDEVLNETSPVKELVVKVNLPKAKNLNYKLLNIDGEPTIGSENGQQVYTWTFKNILASSKESYQVHEHLDAARLVFSSAENLNSVYHSFIRQDAFQLKTNAQMDALVEKVLSENPDQLSAALACQKTVSNNINNLNIPLEYTGFNCRTPIETWNSNQGTELEKALLLSAILQKANITSTPVAVIPNPLFDKKMGDLLSFQEFAVMLELENYGNVLLSSNQVDDQNQVFSMAGKQLLKLDPNLKSPAVFSIVSEMSQIVATASFDLDGSKLSGNMNLEMKAAANPYFSLIEDASAIKSVIKGGISAKDIESTNMVLLSQEKSRSHLEIKKEEAFKKLHHYMSFEIPYIKGGVKDWHYDVLPAERNAALEIPESIHEKYVYTFTFPEDLALVSEPLNIELDNDAGYLLIRFENANDKLVVTREIKLSKKVIEKEIYDDFKEIINAWSHDNFQKILFKTK